MNHPFFELIITHELIHHLIEEYSDKKVRYANMIEEGICDYLSYYFLLKFNLLPCSAIKTFLNYSRALTFNQPILKSYYKFSIK